MEPKLRATFSMYMFTEQYRLAAGLEEVFNDLFHDGKITITECTKLRRRPRAQNVINFIWTHYCVADNMPQVYLSIEKEFLECRPTIFSKFGVASALPGQRRAETLWMPLHSEKNG